MAYLFFLSKHALCLYYAKTAIYARSDKTMHSSTLPNQADRLAFLAYQFLGL